MLASFCPTSRRAPPRSACPTRNSQAEPGSSVGPPLSVFLNLQGSGRVYGKLRFPEGDGAPASQATGRDGRGRLYPCSRVRIFLPGASFVAQSGRSALFSCVWTDPWEPFGSPSLLVVYEAVERRVAISTWASVRMPNAQKTVFRPRCLGACLLLEGPRPLFGKAVNVRQLWR